MYYVRDIPVSIPFQEISSLGFVGRKAELREYMNATLAHITTHHGYDDVKIVGLLSEAEREYWDWIRLLPHTWDKNRKFRYIATNAHEAARLAD